MISKESMGRVVPRVLELPMSRCPQNLFKVKKVSGHNLRHSPTQWTYDLN